jgi:hypothetical protein
MLRALASLTLALVTLAACAPTVHAWTAMRPGKQLADERVVRLIAHDDEAQVLEPMLVAHGFRVVREVPGVSEQPAAPFVLSVNGICQVGFFGAPALKIDVVRVATGERVFGSEMTDASGCPDTFFHEAVEALSRAWDGQG